MYINILNTLCFWFLKQKKLWGRSGTDKMNINGFLCMYLLLLTHDFSSWFVLYSQIWYKLMQTNSFLTANPRQLVTLLCFCSKNVNYSINQKKWFHKSDVTWDFNKVLPLIACGVKVFSIYYYDTLYMESKIKLCKCYEGGNTYEIKKKKSNMYLKLTT